MLRGTVGVTQGRNNPENLQPRPLINSHAQMRHPQYQSHLPHPLIISPTPLLHMVISKATRQLATLNIQELPLCTRNHTPRRDPPGRWTHPRFPTLSLLDRNNAQKVNTFRLRTVTIEAMLTAKVTTSCTLLEA